MTLAYVFWHSPKPELQPHDYEEGLIAFHESLLGRRPSGFRRSATYRAGSVPWLKSEVAVYEDWYIVDDFRALGTLNDAAVSGRRKKPHDRVAPMTAVGTAGLYRLRLGMTWFEQHRDAWWLSKADGWSYEDFDQHMATVLGKAGALWSRLMVLGPTPEFCVHGDGSKITADAVSIPMVRVWAST